MKNSNRFNKIALVAILLISFLTTACNNDRKEPEGSEATPKLQYEASTFSGGETVHYLFRKGAGFISVTTQSESGCPECGIAISGNFRYLDSFPKEASIPGLSQTIILDRESNVQNVIQELLVDTTLVFVPAIDSSLDVTEYETILLRDSMITGFSNSDWINKQTWRELPGQGIAFIDSGAYCRTVGLKKDVYDSTEASLRKLPHTVGEFRLTYDVTLYIQGHCFISYLHVRGDYVATQYYTDMETGCMDRSDFDPINKTDHEALRQELAYRAHKTNDDQGITIYGIDQPDEYFTVSKSVVRSVHTAGKEYYIVHSPQEYIPTIDGNYDLIFCLGDGKIYNIGEGKREVAIGATIPTTKILKKVIQKNGYWRL
jgi:hypothetical protein